jgi:hypothetical protein
LIHCLRLRIAIHSLKHVEASSLKKVDKITISRFNLDKWREFEEWDCSFEDVIEFLCKVPKCRKLSIEIESADFDFLAKTIKALEKVNVKCPIEFVFETIGKSKSRDLLGNPKHFRFSESQCRTKFFSEHYSISLRKNIDRRERIWHIYELTPLPEIARDQSEKAVNKTPLPSKRMKHAIKIKAEFIMFK